MRQTGAVMGAFFEPLILYIVLFFSGSAGLGKQEFINFSISASLMQIFLYNIPSLALIWYLLQKKSAFKNPLTVKPGFKDILSVCFAFTGLVFLGFTIALISPFFPGISQGPVIIPPAGFPAWLVLFISCISTGYLEESFFRFYLLSKHGEMGLNETKAAVISTLLFSLCHIHEGPWGFLNSALSGALLAFIFLRYRSLHGIALAHGLYNITVYVFSSL
jgi:membrane protease YdiL (CAAX protease family)